MRHCGLEILRPLLKVDEIWIECRKLLIFLECRPRILRAIQVRIYPGKSAERGRLLRSQFVRAIEIFKRIVVAM